MLECNNIVNYNKFFISKQYGEFICNDKTRDFKIVDFRLNRGIDYELYLIVNELYLHENKNVLYYKKYIHDQVFYDEEHSFIIKRKKLFQMLQKFNLGMFRLKHILNMKYKTSKNSCNLFGDPFKPNHLELIDGGSKYKFDYFEMYNIVDSSFKNMYQESPIITNIKNPYTNKIFEYFNVINIYFLLMRNERIPKFFYIYFHSSLSKSELYNNYNINLYVDFMKYKYFQFTTETKIRYIDKMLEYYKYFSVLRKDRQFKLNYFTNISLKFFLALKIINRYNDDYPDIYCAYIDDCKDKLIKLRRSGAFHRSYNIKTN